MKKKRGRKLLEIDERKVAKLAEWGWTLREIGSFFGCGAETIRRRFAPAIEKGQAQLKASIRSKQVELALSGDRTMLIWLGKQLLDQREPASTQIAIQNNVAAVEARKRIREEDPAFIEQFNRVTAAGLAAKRQKKP